MGTIRVIAFEDELLHAERIRSAVEELGYHLVDILESTREIEMIAMSLKPDIILMDIDLGTEETGIDAVKRLRKKSAVPVIFTTSYLSNEVFNEAKKTLPQAYLTKPIDTSTLGRSIELALLQRVENNIYGLSVRANASHDHLFVKEDRVLKRISIKDMVQPPKNRTKFY
jgi:AmiR/NasT family two-component response regulator